MSKCEKCYFSFGTQEGTYCPYIHKTCEGVETTFEVPDYTKGFEGEPMPPELIAKEKKENTYRDQLIQEIKDVGESLITNAENIAGDYKFGCRCEIHISFERDEAAVVRVERDFYPENYMYELMGK